VSPKIFIPGLFALALLTATVSAQVEGPAKPASPPEEQTIQQQKSTGKNIKMDVALALVNVTVTDPYNRLVTGLEKEHFRVIEDGVPQEVVSFSAEDVPISIGVVFDMSGSMSDKVDKARQAAVQFLRRQIRGMSFFWSASTIRRS